MLWSVETTNATNPTTHVEVAGAVAGAEAAVLLPELVRAGAGAEVPVLRPEPEEATARGCLSAASSSRTSTSTSTSICSALDGAFLAVEAEAEVEDVISVSPLQKSWRSLPGDELCQLLLFLGRSSSVVSKILL